MPTAARLVAAICLAIVAYILSQMVKPLMPESTDFGYFVPVNMFLGMGSGWFVVGPRAGRGFAQSINNGFAGVFMLVLWAVFTQSCYEMFRLAMRNRYDGAFEALGAVFELAVEYAFIIGTVPMGVVMLISAIVVGPITDSANKRWR